MSQLLKIICVCGHSTIVDPDGEKKRCICGRMVYAKDGPDDLVTPWMTVFDRHGDDGKRPAVDFVSYKSGRRHPNQ